MIEFHYESEFDLSNETEYTEWLKRVAKSEKTTIDALTYIFCSDSQLLEINKEYLNHDDLTDIISFDYGNKKNLSGDIFISVDRVFDNSERYNTTKEQELLRVMAHGLLHFVGYNDKTENEKMVMREKENEKIQMFHVEQ